MTTDWKELIESLKSHGVEFVVVGAHALAVHARPRFTEDIDLFVRRSVDNVDRLVGALQDFGLPVDPGPFRRFASDPRQMVVLGHKPFAVDLLNFLDGVEFDDAIQDAIQSDVVGVIAPVLSLEHLIASKRASGRPKDLADLALIEEDQQGRPE